MSCGRCRAAGDLRITRAAMCATCRHGGRDSTRCAATQRPIALHINGREPCPIGRHPDAAGIVRWMGIRWIGVPMPLRLLVGTERKLPGCGCVLALKRAIESIRRR